MKRQQMEAAVLSGASNGMPTIQIFDGKKPAPYMNEGLLEQKIFSTEEAQKRSSSQLKSMSQEELRMMEAGAFTLGQRSLGEDGGESSQHPSPDIVQTKYLGLGGQYQKHSKTLTAGQKLELKQLA